MASQKNYDDNATITGSSGNDSISNSATNVTINAEAGDDTILNGSFLGFFFGQGFKNVVINGGAGNDTITNNGDNVQLNGDNGDDLIFNGCYSSVGYDFADQGYDNENKSSNVTINGGAGNDTIFSYGDNVTINPGSGNNYIYAKGSNVFIDNSAGGNNVVNGQNITIVSDNTSNQTLYGSRQADTFQYSSGGGNDVIVNYSGEDTVQIVNGKVDSYEFDGGDLIFNIGSGSLRLKNMTNHAITVKDSTGTSTKIYSNGYSQQQVIQNFVQSMANTALNSALKLDEAIKNSSGFNSLQEVIDKMVADCRTVNDAETFLRDYCGIFTDNKDTGAIIGWDTGGLTMKTHDDLMPETSAAVYPNSTVISSRGLTLTLPEKSSLSEQEQLVIQGLNSWWLKNSTKLIEESYGLSFNDKPDTIPFYFEYKPGDFGWAWGGPSVSVNMAYTSFEESDKTGGGLDGALLHEFTHVLQCNFDIWSYMPNYMVEGMANLTGGSDEYTEIAGNADSLAAYLNVDNNFSDDGNVYTVGYLFWRYLMKQAADSYDSLSSYSWKNNSNITGTAAAEFLTSSGENQTLSGGNGADTLTIYGKNSKLFGDEGNDYILIGEIAENLTVQGGAGKDSIFNQGTKINIDGGAGNDSVENFGANVTIDGGADNDSITSQSDNVSISGGDGNDTLQVQKTSNYNWDTSSWEDTFYKKATIDGGGGNDYIQNENTNATINGGAGNDNVKNYGDTVKVEGDAGADIIINGEFFAKGGVKVSLSGGAGDDTITNSGSNSVIDGGAGNDLIHNGYYYYEPWDAYYDSSYYGEHDDSLKSSNVTITGGAGDDSIANRGENVVYLYNIGDGNDTISGYLSSNKIQIATTTYSTTSSGNDIIINIGNGSINLVDAKTQKLNIETIKGGGGTDTIPPDTLPAGISIKNSVLTASSSFTGSQINLTDYPTATKVNASALKNAVEIIGTAAANSLKGGKGADTISGGSGNDTVSLGGGNDVYIYSGGNDLIQDYKSGADKIKLSSSSITSASLKSSDVVLTTSNGTLTIKKGKGKNITVIDSSGNETTKIYPAGSTETLPAGISIKNSVLTASSKFTGSQINLADYPAATKVNASALKNAVEIVGTAANNSLKGGKGADTISGGNGNDTLYGGKGNDLFVYTGGDDFIADYKTGEDKISANYTSSTVTGSNVILTTANGKLTIKGAKDKAVTFVDGSEKIFYADTSYSPLATGLKYDTKKITLTASTKFTGSQINLDDYLSSVTKVNASALKNSVEIIGTTANNSLKGGKGADTLSGGAGNDTLTGGKGADVFIYSAGKDVITDYTAEDEIQINGKITKTAYSGKNIVFTIGSGTLTVKNGKGKNISVTDSSGSQTYSKTADLFEDNNFIAEENNLDTITENKFAVTQIQTPNYSALEQNNQTVLTFAKK